MSLMFKGSRCPECFSRLIVNKSDDTVYCSTGKHKFISSIIKEEEITLCPICGKKKINKRKNICEDGHVWMIKDDSYSLHLM